MTIPRVYAAINAVSACLAQTGLPKDQFNLADDYAYRSIDELYCRLAPLLAEHRLCVLPRVIERTQSEVAGLDGEVLIHVTVRSAFDLVSAEDGSRHNIASFGEALDASDKGTAKAMTSAYKYAMIEAFCIPVVSAEDPDRISPQRAPHVVAPAQGWDLWSGELTERVGRCDSVQALERLQDRHRARLHGLSRERPELYAQLGVAVAARRSSFANSETAVSEVSVVAKRRSRHSRKAAHTATSLWADGHA